MSLYDRKLKTVIKIPQDHLLSLWIKSNNVQVLAHTDDLVSKDLIVSPEATGINFVTHVCVFWTFRVPVPIEVAFYESPSKKNFFINSSVQKSSKSE